MRLPLSMSLRVHVARYGESHRTLPNRALHIVGIPCLVVSIFGLLAKIPLPRLGLGTMEPNAAWVALGFGALWYLWQDRLIGLLTTALFVVSYLVASWLSLEMLIVLGAIGVLLHAIGHFWFERNLPVFLSRPIAVLEAPAWLLSFLLEKGVQEPRTK